jgi:lysophospholipase L1-like esterase
MRAVRGLAAALVTLVALVAAGSAAADPAVVGYPASMASTGDSITRAFNTCAFPFVDCPSNSWSTGSSATVNSQYRRILAVNAVISGRAYNDAVTGADMADLEGQVRNAVAQGAQYVTILMGANDVCASSEAGMTPVDTFRGQFEQALATLSAGLPNARIAVSSIPDVYNLWAIYKDSFSARLVWGLGGICQSLLANPGSTSQADVDRRNRVRARNIAYNVQLADVCALYVHCDFDGNIVFSTPFVRSDVSTRDYFHPSIAGQAKLAFVSWSATFDFTDQVAPSSSGVLTDGAVTITADDNVYVRGVEYRLGSGGWTRYTAPVPLAPGETITWRAIDVNGNAEATQTING